MYRDGNKIPETRFNKVYTHSSRTEQASEITMTPALYHRTIQIATRYYVITTCTQYMLPSLCSAMIQCWCHYFFRGLLSSTSVCSNFIDSCLWAFVTIPTSSYFRICNLLVYSLFLLMHLQLCISLSMHAQKCRRVSNLELMCVY